MNSLTYQVRIVEKDIPDDLLLSPNIRLDDSPCACSSPTKGSCLGRGSELSPRRQPSTQLLEITILTSTPLFITVLFCLKGYTQMTCAHRTTRFVSGRNSDAFHQDRILSRLDERKRSGIRPATYSDQNPQ